MLRVCYVNLFDQFSRLNFALRGFVFYESNIFIVISLYVSTYAYLETIQQIQKYIDTILANNYSAYACRSVIL